MQKYTQVITLKITEIQKQTLSKLKNRDVKVSDFIRKTISEKIQREVSELTIKPKKEYTPF